MSKDNLEKLLASYQSEILDPATIPSNPFKLFNAWLESAVKMEFVEPNAFVLSTVYQGRPRSRVVLLKDVDQGQFIFYTNYQSAKGHEIAEAQYVSMNFWWGSLARQIRVEGTIKKVSAETSDAYFQTRPRGSQMGAIASPQSQVVTTEDLQEYFSKVVTEYEKVAVIPRPEHWGGYAINPEYIEFWQGRPNRMHDRVSYRKKGDVWELTRLAP